MTTKKQITDLIEMAYRKWDGGHYDSAQNLATIAIAHALVEMLPGEQKEESDSRGMAACPECGKFPELNTQDYGYSVACETSACPFVMTVSAKYIPTAVRRWNAMAGVR